MSERIVFFNIGWMQYYKGQAHDQIKGGGSFVTENGTGGEIYNFLPIDQYVYGYVQPTGKINLSRIDSSIATGADVLENVLIVYTAKSPEGGVYVVGWHKNSTLYSKIYTASFYCDEDTNGEIINATENGEGLFEREHWYISRTHKDNAVLLNVDERVLRVPVGKEGKGHSNVWFADKGRGLEFREKVISFIIEYENDRQAVQERRSAKRIDADYNKRIELAAIDYMTKYYEKHGYVVVSKEKDNVGWDLEARKDHRLLRIEVKGKAGQDIDVRLSPNEYAKMQQYKDKCYRLAVVTDALCDPTEYIFFYSKEKNGWVELFDSDLRLNIQEIVEARCTGERVSVDDLEEVPVFDDF